MKRQRKGEPKQAPINTERKVGVVRAFKGTQVIVTVDGNGPFTRHVKGGYILHDGERLPLEVPRD